MGGGSNVTCSDLLGIIPCEATVLGLYSYRMSKYFTTEEAATYLGVTPSRVRQYIAEDRLTSDKLGRDHMIKEDDLEYFVKQGKKKRGRPPKSKLENNSLR